VIKESKETSVIKESKGIVESDWKVGLSIERVPEEFCLLDIGVRWHDL
jgi:hypothetical protein